MVALTPKFPFFRKEIQFQWDHTSDYKRSDKFVLLQKHGGNKVKDNLPCDPRQPKSPRLRPEHPQAYVAHFDRRQVELLPHICGPLLLFPPEDSHFLISNSQSKEGRD